MATTPTQVEQAKLDAAKKATTAIVNPLINKLNAKLTVIGALRAKRDQGKATPKEMTTYAQTKLEIAAITNQLTLAGQIDANTQQKIQAELLADKLTKLSSSPGTLTFATFKDFLDVILRTQAINPYSRMRACDIEFIDMLSNLGADTSAQKDMLEALKKRLIDRLKP